MEERPKYVTFKNTILQYKMCKPETFSNSMTLRLVIFNSSQIKSSN